MEASVIMRTLVENCRTYEQAVEASPSASRVASSTQLCTAPGYGDSDGRSHTARLRAVPSPRNRPRDDRRIVRPAPLDAGMYSLTTRVPRNTYYATYGQVGVLFLQTLNHFQRFAYVRLAHAREQRLQAEQQRYPPPLQTRAHSNSSAQSERLNGAY